MSLPIIIQKLKANIQLKELKIKRETISNMDGTHYQCKCPRRDSKKQQSHSSRRSAYKKHRQISLTEAEKVILSSLLIDSERTSSTSTSTFPFHSTRTTASSLPSLTLTSASFTDDMLFSTPFTDGIRNSYSIETNPSMEFDKYHIKTGKSSDDEDDSLVLLKDMDTKNLWSNSNESPIRLPEPNFDNLVARNVLGGSSSKKPWYLTLQTSGEKDVRDDDESNKKPHLVSPTTTPKEKSSQHSKSPKMTPLENRDESFGIEDIIDTTIQKPQSLYYKLSMGSLMDSSSSSSGGTSESFSVVSSNKYDTYHDDEASLLPVTTHRTNRTKRSGIHKKNNNKSDTDSSVVDDDRSNSTLETIDYRDSKEKKEPKSDSNQAKYNEKKPSLEMLLNKDKSEVSGRKGKREITLSRRDPPRPPLNKVKQRGSKKQENGSKPKIPLKRMKPAPLNKNKRNTTEVTSVLVSSPLGSNASSSPKSPLLQQRPAVMGRTRIRTAGEASPSSTNSLASNNTPNSKMHTALWLVHGKGNLSSFLCQGTKTNTIESDSSNDDNVLKAMKKDLKVKYSIAVKEKEINAPDDELKVDEVIGKATRSKHSDETKPQSDKSKPISWDKELVPQYDCWQILKDEYVHDYGFAAKDEETSTLVSNSPASSTDKRQDDIAEVDSDDDTDLHDFKILGTGVDDLSAQPHVLSPPLMDSLLNFLPNSLKYENFWLKYSLVRDGSSIDTFRRYTRASINSILAIETLNGDVFGCFTTSPWENEGNEFNGNGESFVWKMRYNRRNSNCQSLYDQAHLESEIDVFPNAGISDVLQSCTHTLLALGGSDANRMSPQGFSFEQYQQLTFDINEAKGKPNKNTDTGFAIALYDDLSRGTTNPCPTYCSPSLISDGGDRFEVANVELWSFTPCHSVLEAQKLEMRKYFITQKSSSIGQKSKPGELSSKDIFQGEFYRRLGEKKSTNAFI